MINRLKSYYNNLSAPLKTSFWFVLCSIVQKGIIFITTPIFTRIMTKDEYGVVSVYNSWHAIITIIATLQLSAGAFNKAMIKYDHDRDGYVSASFGLSIISIIISIIIFYPISIIFHNAIDLSPSFIILLFVEIFFSNAMALLTSRERFEFKYKLVAILTFMGNILATIVSLVFVVLSDENKAFFRIFGIVIIHVMVYSIAIFIILKRNKTIFNKEYWLYAIHFNIPLIPHYLSQQVLNSSDRIMINDILGSDSAAMYSLGYQIAVVMGILSSSIHASFAPWTYQKIKLHELESIGKRALQIELFIGGMCLLFSFFAPEFIMILGGINYKEAMYIVPPVSMSVLFSIMYSFFGNVEFYFEKTKFVMIASCIAAGMNILLNSIYIPIYGYVAAGYTTLFCYIAYSFIHFLFMKKICKDNYIDNPYKTTKMWIIAILFVILSLGVTFIYEFYVIRYIIVIIIAFLMSIFFLKNKTVILGKE